MHRLCPPVIITRKQDGVNKKPADTGTWHRPQQGPAGPGWAACLVSPCQTQPCLPPGGVLTHTRCDNLHPKCMGGAADTKCGSAPALSMCQSKPWTGSDSSRLPNSLSKEGSPRFKGVQPSLSTLQHNCRASPLINHHQAGGRAGNHSPTRKEHHKEMWGRADRVFKQQLGTCSTC